jgi:hypothetical protein
MEWIVAGLAWPGAASGPMSGLVAATSFVVAVVLTAAVALLARSAARERRELRRLTDS